MGDPYIDTDVIIRLLTGDDPVKQAAAAALFESVASGEVVIAAPNTIIADAVHVLSSRVLYRLDREQISSLLRPLVSMSGFRVQQRSVVLRALDLYAATRLDWGDVMIVAAMERSGSTSLYAYDHDFDRIAGIERREP